MEQPKTPELEKLSAVAKESQAIGAFIDDLEYRGYVICEVNEGSYDHTYMPTSKSVERLLAEHYEIDLDACEKERRALLEYIRSKNA